VEKKEIRTHYSGVIVFAAKLATVATGIAFALIVANSLSQTEYGILGIFNIIIPYFTILAGAIPFWTMRLVSRGAEGAAKTGVFANFALAIVAVLAYLALLPVISPAFRLGS
jgi:O-antigen/teichoic acid export membrane protein